MNPETLETVAHLRPRLPDWLRIKLPTSDTYARTRSLLAPMLAHATYNACIIAAQTRWT